MSERVNGRGRWREGKERGVELGIGSEGGERQIQRGWVSEWGILLVEDPGFFL